MINKKPTFRKLAPSFGSSILVKQHVDTVDKNGAYWHFHPELELIYINKGQGKTHIGNHLSYFNNSQLILIGSNLPHNGFTDRLTANGTETTVQFKSNFLGDDFLNVPEFPVGVGVCFLRDSLFQNWYDSGEILEMFSALNSILFLFLRCPVF